MPNTPIVYEIAELGLTEQLSITFRDDSARNACNNILNAIAPRENGYTATRAYAAGDFLFVGSTFYRTTAAIASGGAITPNTNVVETKVANWLGSSLPDGDGVRY